MRSQTVNLLDHAQAPRNIGKLESATVIGTGQLSDDRPFVTLFLNVADGKICDARFETRGCGYALAIGSALTEWMKGKTPIECGKISARDVAAAFGGLPPQKQYCAELAIDALQDAIEQLEDKDAP